MKINFSTGSLYVYPLSWIFSMAADAGFDGVELVIGPEPVLRGPASVLKLAEARGLNISSIHPPLFDSFAWRDTSDTLKVMQFAADVGATVVVCHTPNAKDWDSSEGRKWQRETDAARRWGAKKGVTLALENRAFFVDYHRAVVLADPEALYRYAEKHDYSLTFDTAHAASWPFDILEIYGLFRDRLVNVHLSDFKPLPAWLDQPRLHSYLKHHQLLGSGELPLKKLLNHVRSDGYDGYVTLELSPIALQAWWPARIRSNLAATIRFANGAGGRSRAPERDIQTELRDVSH